MRALLLALSFLAAPGMASADSQPGFFILGDCVEYDTTIRFNPALRWRKARVIDIDDYFITIALDGVTPDPDVPTRVSTASAGKWLRAAKGCAAQPGTDEPGVLPDGVPVPLPDEPDTSEAAAPPPPPLAGPFNIGDCIEYDTTNRFQPALRWRKGRITDIDEFDVTIELDYEKVDPDIPRRVSTAAVTKWLRPAKGCAPVKQHELVHAGFGIQLASYQSRPAALPANVPAKPVAGLECPLVQTKVSPKPDQAVLANVIRCLFEKDTDIESVRAHVDSQKIGQSRRWNPLDDLGNGKMSTTVFPVRVDWRLIRYYRDSIQMSENVSVFNCFVNTFDEWECGLASRIRDGNVVSYRRSR